MNWELDQVRECQRSIGGRRGRPFGGYNEICDGSMKRLFAMLSIALASNRNYI